MFGEVDLRPSTELTARELRNKIYKLEEENTRLQKLLKKARTANTVLYNIQRSENYNSKQMNDFKEQVEQLSGENYHLKTKVNNLITAIYGERVLDGKVTPEQDILFVESITGKLGILRRSRSRGYVYARQILYYILRSRGMSLKAIGKLCKRDHSTVIHALKTYRLDISINDQETINNYLYGNKNKENGNG